jgi:6-phosphogluconolactonase
MYVGTYTSLRGKGIYLFDFNPATGELKSRGVAAEVANPSFLAVHPNRRFLYAVGEINDFEGKKSGAVSAFAVAADTGKLTLLNQQPSGGRGPCHLTIDRDGKHVLVANYSTGSAAVLPIAPDGRLAKASSVVQHKGSGPNAKRQEGPHAHSINLDPAGRYAFVADLGADKVFVYRFDSAKGTLVANDPPAAVVAPGSGPRHFAFDPRARCAYVINELASTVTAFAYDADRGALKEIQTIATLPEDFREPSFTAHILVHPSGRFAYGSNRGHDSIAVFAIDPGTGKLERAGHDSTRGKTPRNFAISPGGEWLIAANQNSDTLAVFRIDARSGRLIFKELVENVPSAVCLLFASPEP